MLPRPPFPPKILAVLAVFALAGCQAGSTPRGVPSVPQIGADLKCATGDHGFEDQQAGWGFCYPDTWRYTERAQAYPSPRELDLTFDITFAPSPAVACPNPRPPGTGACPGDFAFMILSTYERGSSADLASWFDANQKTAPQLEEISWGNALEAARLPDGRRVALTPHQVVIMDLHSGLLDLETEMSSRLGTWKFSY